MDKRPTSPSSSPDGTGSSINTIVLQLALNPGADEAAMHRAQGYVITAPLDSSGRLNLSGLTSRRWPARRFGDPGDGEIGWLTHRGAAWFIDYDDATTTDDEAIYRLSEHRFVIGEYLTITSGAGKPLTYRVVSAEPAA